MNAFYGIIIGGEKNGQKLAHTAPVFRYEVMQDIDTIPFDELANSATLCKSETKTYHFHRFTGYQEIGFWHEKPHSREAFENVFELAVKGASE